MFLGYIVKYCVKKYVYVWKVKFIFLVLDFEKNIGYYEIVGKCCW